jgi:pyruvate dehydrogenase E2 component (dihydrolipoamide acetyltransferase)
MPTQITMPQQSDTMTEGTVVKWRKKEGDKVKAGEVVAEIETDKAVMEMEAFDAGTLAYVIVPEGQKVPVGGAIAILATGKENPAEVKKQYQSVGGAGGSAGISRLADSAAQTPAKASATAGGSRVPAPTTGPQGGAVATLEAASVSEIHEPQEAGHPAARGSGGANSPPAPEGMHGEGNGHGNGDRIFASPLARRIAKDKGIDLQHIKGTGPGGRIVQKDVLEFGGDTAEPGAERSAAPDHGARQTQVMPMTKMRAAIAAALQRSKQQIPHFYETIDIDVEELSSLRARLNEQLKKLDVKLSLADFVAKGVCAALLKHPVVNSTFDGTNITRHASVHLGMAVAVADGLIVPVLKHADKMGLRELREKTVPLVERARAGRQKQDEASGGTFTISSLGSFGIREFAAIINPPQVAILAVGAAEKRAVVKGDQIVARTMMSVTLSADHRIVDGATAADFLRTLKTLLEEPGMMLV